MWIMVGRRTGPEPQTPGGGPETGGLQGRVAGVAGRPSPSARSTVSRPSAPSRTEAASAAALGASRSGSSVQDSRVRPPRSTYSTSDPLTSTTSAPAFRPGRCEVGVSPGRSGQGSAAP